MKRIITANVNGIRAAERKGFFDWMKTQNADVVCVQEIKAQEDQLDDKFYPKGIHTYYKPAERKGYSGTGLYCKDKPDRVIFSPWEDIDFEGRFIQADFRNLSVISIYIPSGSSKQERQDYKMNFMIERFMPYLKKLQEDGRQYIVCGDINIVHKEIDIKNFASNKNHSGCLPEERAWMEQLFTEAKFIDAFREVNQEKHQYTWWSNRGQAWANNTGWRIDYQILSANLKDTPQRVEIYKNERFSDHSPLIIDYNL
ncbi:exodeoxyribonuclease III [Candidatus Thioglobus sp.]|jgi:exodeoxyribonuclease-3|uniref:exodeoxyribonuclease III n=1 Tax=Candidatus Thioglobus sp. TaxID=2026721 RepID=UPI0001BD37C5|nr:exodeoxyribonuclease III [Candidatus Thioglobus sp.]EEZ80020.1 MAG: exonuclease III [uncultured Candidatus Thioglobus sp.]MBT3187258.1 exodeoxyribonuclease III [Candidatus Thioglobus sp.]MBT3431489.1 exodeoxyribonuclease III [Candidatus Thioglobus sp.]MBT3965899.1 exodeoxyribonuclease III [Candidatus Thioglobus sp.]MBT4316526.1 exodeoxyribonuclease III [Candidatus Thioglobus sp.]